MFRNYCTTLLLLSTTLSCGGGVPEDVNLAQVIAKLREQPEAAYRFDYRLETDVFYLSELDPFPAQFDGTFLQSEEPWVSSSLMREYMFGELDRVSFSKESQGMRHTLASHSWGGPEWECTNQRFDRGPIGPLGFFPVVDGGLRSEAAALLGTYPPTDLAVDEGQVVLRWETIPVELVEILRRQHRAPLSPPDLNLERLELHVDWAKGFPSKFLVHFPEQQSLTITYLDPGFLTGSYLEARDALRAQVDVPLSVRCGDDGAIYNVMIQLPGWEERRWDSDD